MEIRFNGEFSVDILKPIRDSSAFSSSLYYAPSRAKGRDVRAGNLEVVFQYIALRRSSRWFWLQGRLRRRRGI